MRTKGKPAYILVEECGPFLEQEGALYYPPSGPPGHWASAAGVCSETPGSWPTPPGDPGRHPQGRESRLHPGPAHYLALWCGLMTGDSFFIARLHDGSVNSSMLCVFPWTAIMNFFAWFSSMRKESMIKKKNARICQDALMLAN